MIRTTYGFAGALALLGGHSLMAAELAVAPNEIENLGIELATPRSVERFGAVDARARVVIPPTAEYVVSSPQPGLLVRLLAAAGDEVISGQMLAELRSPDFLTLQRDFLEAVNGHTLVRGQLKRDEQLFEEGIISKRRLEEAQARAKTAGTGLREHRQLLRLGGLSDNEISALAANQQFLEVVAIRAPIDGVVLELMAVAGEQVEAMAPVYRVADLGTLWLDIQLPQEQITAVAPGMKVAVADCVVELPAEVTVVGRAVDPKTQTVSVRAALTHPDHELKPGQFLSVQVVTGRTGASPASVWAVPASAVVRSGEHCYLFVRTAAGFEVREVQMIGADGDEVYIGRGIAGDTPIAVTGVSALKALWSGQEEAGA